MNGERAQNLATHIDPTPGIDAPRTHEVVAIVRDHATYVWRTLRFMGVPEADLEDACQEVFIVVCRKLDGFEARSSIKTWLRGICLRKAAAYRRRAHVRNEVLSEPRDEQAPDCPEQSVEERQALALLHRALETLDDDKRAVFVLHEIDQLSMKEVADALGCPLQTAYSRYHAARERVASYVKRAGKPTRDNVDAIARGVIAGIGAPNAPPVPLASSGILFTVASMIGVAGLAAYVATRDAEAPSVLEAAPPVAVTFSAPAAKPAPLPPATSSASPAPPRPAVAPPPSETALLDAAQRALAADPAAALRRCDEHARHYPGGALGQEREVIAIDALVRLGRRSEAEARGERFRQAHPSSGHVRRIDVLLGK